MPKPERERMGLTISDTFTDAETDVLIEIMRAGGFSTPASAVRCALWKLAQHLDVECPPELFRLCRPKGPRP
jgi:hypothetical protein